MNRLATRSILSITAMAGTVLVLACSAAPPGEGTSSSGEALVFPKSCPTGWTKDCDNGPNGTIVCGGCYPIDDYFTITQMAQTPIPGDNDTSWLDLGPFPYPPELAGMGCSKTAVIHHDQYDTTGGRIWYCPSGWLEVPPSIAPLPAPPLGQHLETGEKLNSRALGSPTSGNTSLAEDIWPPCTPPNCKISHGCSGACSLQP